MPEIAKKAVFGINQQMIFDIQNLSLDSSNLTPSVYSARVLNPSTHPRIRRINQRHAVRALLGKIQPHSLIDRLPLRLSNGDHVSFSHSGDTVLCAYYHRPVAVDIEMRTIKTALAQRFFHHNDIIWANGDSAQFARLWRLHECLVKLHGGSLPIQLATPIHDKLHGFSKDDERFLVHESTNFSLVWQTVE